MAKKKKEKFDDEPAEEISAAPIHIREDKKFKATEWAVQKGHDPHLFLYWANQMLSEQEFEKIKREVKGE